eukprot:TRINITY_DN5561_c0_g1_i3.p2 TRINITY_DN5561_c0_g1~~TRINITY_DN5561_c0_g1_i3.p2  ORF type:complete len:121 (+),score=8.94 TRINITY_DN5561_c0_g1_i3:38-400(+)
MATSERRTLLILTVLGFLGVILGQSEVTSNGRHTLKSTIFFYLGIAFLLPFFFVSLVCLCYIPYICVTLSLRPCCSTDDSDAGDSDENQPLTTVTLGAATPGGPPCSHSLEDPHFTKEYL